MEFILAFHQPANAHAEMATDQQTPLAWMGAMAAAGVMRSGSQLDPRSSRIVRLRNGQREVQEVRPIEQHSLMGGYVVIDVASVEEAMEWAEQSPSSSDCYTEVIPVLPNARPKTLAFSFM